MTSRTSPDAVDYWWTKTAMSYIRKDLTSSPPSYSFDKAKIFKEGGLEIYVVN
jgi:hypothetical protein